MFEVITTGQGEQYLQFNIYGSINIESIAGLKGMLQEAFSTTDHLVVDLSGVDEVDFTALQLMCAVNKYALDTGKMFELKNRFIPPVLQSMKRLGFIRETGCRKDNKDRCLWIVPDSE